MLGSPVLANYDMDGIGNGRYGWVMGDMCGMEDMDRNMAYCFNFFRERVLYPLQTMLKFILEPNLQIRIT